MEEKIRESIKKYFDEASIGQIKVLGDKVIVTLVSDTDEAQKSAELKAELERIDGVKRARRKLKLFHREFMEGKRLFSDIEQYMECQSAYYRNFNDHGRLLKLRRLYHAIFFGGAKCSESSKMGQVLA